MATNKNKLFAKALLPVSAGIMVLLALHFLLPSMLVKFLEEKVPDNPGFSLPPEPQLAEIIPKNLGGGVYSELAYAQSLDGRKWLVPCYSAIGIDDAEDVCRGFSRGYLMKYPVYKLLDGTVATGSYKISQQISPTAEDGQATVTYENEKMEGDYALLLNILEYDSPEEARSACTFFIWDASFDRIQMDGVNVLTKEDGDWAHYALPTDKIIISIQGNRAAVREAMEAVVEKYKK